LSSSSDNALAAHHDISAVERLFHRIRRRETPFYDWLYRVAKAARRIEMPNLRPLYRLLYHERQARLAVWRNFTRVVYNQPLFKSRCESVGKGLYVWGGIPVVMGHLRIRIGDNCTLAGATTFTGSKMAQSPTLEIGDHSNIGWQTVILVGTRVTIGKHVAIANRCVLFGADGHPLDPVKRRTEAESAASLREMVIEDDVYIASESIIHKGVTIGKAAVVSAGSVVTKDVPPYTVVAGNPARVIWRIPKPREESH